MSIENKKDRLQELLQSYINLIRNHLNNGFKNNYEIKLIIGYREDPKGLWIKETSLKVIE